MPMSTTEQGIADALASPYTRIFRKQEDGGYQASVLELPGVMTGGDSLEETNELLEEAMALWLEHELNAGHDIPPPLDPERFSGRLTLRIPPTLHHRAQMLAELSGISLNRLLSDAVATGLSTAVADPDRPHPLPDQRLVEYVTSALARVGVSEGARAWATGEDDPDRVGHSPS
ncbi:MAG: type II toxin-antitoxin system HicB family antitoxin [Dehalococcoidia bacterium]